MWFIHHLHTHNLIHRHEGSNMRAFHLKTPLLSFRVLAVVLFLACLAISGCGEGKFGAESGATDSSDKEVFPIIRNTETTIMEHWEKKSTDLGIVYPRKRYSQQTDVQATPDSDLLTFSINSDSLNPMATGFMEFPATLSPSGTALRINFTDPSQPIQLSDDKQIVLFRKSGTMDVLNSAGLPITSDYNLSIIITKKITTKTNGQTGPKPVAQYICHATLILDAFNKRTTLTETIHRTDTDDPQALFAGADLILKSGKSYTATCEVAAGESADTVQVPYGLIGLNVSINSDETGDSQAQGTILLPFEATPAMDPFMAISFDGAQPMFSDDPLIHIESPAQIDMTDTNGFLTSTTASLTLDISPLDPDTYLCSASISSHDRLTRIEFTKLELARKDSGTDLSNSQWAVITSSNYVMNCTSGDPQKISESDMDLDLTLHKRLKQDQVFISAEGNLNINGINACADQVLSLHFSDSPVTLSENGRGFNLNTLITQGDHTYELTIILVENEKDQNEFQVDVILPNNNVLFFKVPAERTQRTGTILSFE